MQAQTEGYCEWKQGSLVVKVPRELGHHEADQLRQEADRLIDSCQVRQLVFDFSQTEFMDSAGIGVIIGRCRAMGYHGGSVVARNLSGRLQKIFAVSGLHKLIQTEPREAAGRKKEDDNAGAE